MNLLRWAVQYSLVLALSCQITLTAMADAGGTNGVGAAITPAPLPPRPKSPVDLFRELLAMSNAERREFLANRSPESRRQILAKIREYESLKAEVRELRLRATELRYYMLPLMNMSPTNRGPELAMMAPADRKLVEDRLQEWDRLPAAVQKELLDNEAAIRYFSETESADADQKRPALENLPPAQRTRLETQIAQWRALSEDQHQKIRARFARFFELTDAEKTRALNTLSEAERAQIEKTLRAYSALPTATRNQCLRGFEKFARLTVEERHQFLKNAERWILMSPSERQAWRDLVAKLTPQPPLPPNVDLPPIPSSRPLPRKPGGPPVATNLNPPTPATAP